MIIHTTHRQAIDFTYVVNNESNYLTEIVIRHVYVCKLYQQHLF